MSLFLESQSVSVVNGSTTVTVLGSVNCSQVYPGTGVLISNILVEGIAGTAANNLGTSTITLSKPWGFADVSAVRLVAFNTIEGMGQAIRMARSAAEASAGVLQSFNLVLSSTSPTVEIDLNDVPINVVPYGYLAQQSAALIASLESAETGFADLEQDVLNLTADVASQQSVVTANLTTSQNAANTATTQAGLATGAASAAQSSEADALAASATATAQAGIATTKANEAAASAVIADTRADDSEYWAGVAQAAAGSVSGALSYNGNHSAATGNFPATPAEGSAIWRISVAGTISSVSFKVDDFLIYDLSNTQWRRLSRNTPSIEDVSNLQTTLDNIEALAIIGMIR